jgi:hypothetical protein
MKDLSLLMAPAFGGVVLAACTSTTTSPAVVCGPDDVATTNWDVVATTNYEAAWYYASLDAIPLGFYAVESAEVGLQADPAATSSATSSAAAATAVAASVGHYFPNGCAIATATGNVVTFRLNNCAGPLGLVGSTGTVTATITLVSNAVQIQLAGNNIAANGAVVNLATSGTLTAGANGQKTLQSNTHSNGTGPDGNGIAHTGMYTLVWPTGTGCATLNAMLSDIGSGAYSGTTTQITNYVACLNRCPQSGTATSAFNGGTVTLAFNGSNTAQCTSSIGTSASIPLHCP